MIKNVSIRNFKSIKGLDFKAKRVNVFIGEPNTGKSNILEALGMFSLGYSGTTRDVPIRYQETGDLLYHNETSLAEETWVKADQYFYKLKGKNKLEVFEKEDKNEREVFEFDLHKKECGPCHSNIPIKFYQFKVLEMYKAYHDSKFLIPPHGNNLFDVLMNDKLLKSLVSGLFREKGYRLGLRLKDKEIEMTKEIEDVLYTYPYTTLSDTLQRVIFYWAIIETNKNSTILLEEPESHMSAVYVRDIADRIAHDVDNQYILVTHNPYFLTTIIEKTKPKDLAIFITRLDDYQTQLTQLTPDHITELLDLDAAVFLNLDKLVTLESVH